MHNTIIKSAILTLFNNLESRGASIPEIISVIVEVAVEKDASELAAVLENYDFDELDLE